MSEARLAPETRPFVVGVTGNIASGKTTVMGLLADRGAMTLDADAVYHRLVAPGLPLWVALQERFGPGVVADDGTLDRRRLGAIVFADAEALADLDRLTHPAVVAAIEAAIAAIGVPLVAVDAVKLVESGLAERCDRLWVVTCPPAVQVERLMARNGYDRAEAERRVAAQPSLEMKLARADVVLDNGGDLAYLVAQVERAWADLPETVRLAMGDAATQPEEPSASI